MDEQQGENLTTLILNIDEKDMANVLAAAGAAASQDDVSGFLAAPVVDGGLSGTNCKVFNSPGGKDFACGDPD